MGRPRRFAQEDLERTKTDAIDAVGIARFDTFHERVKGQWEERFEQTYSFWQGLADEAVARYLDCGS